MAKTPDEFRRKRGLLVPQVACVSRRHTRSGRDKGCRSLGCSDRGWIPLAALLAARAESVVYEVFGPVGTVADISYFEVNSDPQQIDGARLPWTIKITTDSPAVVGNVVAQGEATVLAAGSS